MANRAFVLLTFALLLIPNLLHATLLGQVTRTNFSNSQNEIYGWACDDANRNTTYKVDIYADGQHLGTTIANIFSTPVQFSCSNTYFHAFVFTLPDSLRDGVAHQITATAQPVGGGTSFTLSGSPLSVTVPTSQPLKGWFDFLNTDYAWGWACNPAHTSQSAPDMSVAFYLDNGTYLGSVQPLIHREAAVGALCGGQRYRAFQFLFPSSAKNNQTHAVYAYAQNLDGSGRVLLNSAPMQHLFFNRSYALLAQQPSVTATNAASVMSTLGMPGNIYGAYYVLPYCFGANPTSTALSWTVSSYTGFYPSDGSHPLSTWQRGVVDMSGLGDAVQAQGAQSGMFINNSAPYVDSGCGGLAGANTQFAWYLSGAHAAPVVWPSPSQSDKSRELDVSFQLETPTATNVAYVGVSFLFRTIAGLPSGDKTMYYDIQAFDTRASQSVEGHYGSCTPSSCSSPIFYTSFGLNGNYRSYGRTLTGNFVHSTSTMMRSYEFRLNAYQLENALQVVGCSNSNSGMLPCDGNDYRFSIVAIGAENLTGSILGATVKNLKIGYTSN